ncbi:MAG: tRNA (guanosine(46)-N7)-methyltransferase TrmB [Candidatus Latescibacterota bacterium]|jgi:tRNA (guanine-N7-)-methyltransferase
MSIGADLELLLQLADIDDVDPVIRWFEVFANEKPIEIEIGIGKGRFLVDAADRRPDANFVGVEWAMKYLRMAHARSVRSGLDNMRFVRADAREFVEFFVPSATVQAYHIYFPDPWPKKRHHKRRLFNDGFLREIERTLASGGRLWLATDFADYYEAMLDVLDRSEILHEIEVDWEGARTNYEEKYLAAGKPIFRRVMEIDKG